MCWKIPIALLDACFTHFDIYLGSCSRVLVVHGRNVSGRNSKCAVNIRVLVAPCDIATCDMQHARSCILCLSKPTPILNRRGRCFVNIGVAVENHEGGGRDSIVLVADMDHNCVVPYLPSFGGF